jgi:sugar phosphate isomerase/epimerase
MRYAYSTLACPAWSVQQMVEAARRLGYAALEIRVLDGEVIDPVADRAKVESAVAQCRAEGVEACALDTSCRLYHRSPAERDRYASELTSWIRLAADVQVPLLRLFGGEIEPSSGATPTEAEVDARVVEVLRQAAPQAEQAGVTLVLETHDIFASALRTGRVLSEVNSPAAGALWDTLHPYRVGESPEQALAALGPYLLHVHIKDARRPGPGSHDWRQMPLGEGDVPLEEVLALLRGHGYPGYISVEWEKKWHPDLEEPELALPQHIAWLLTQKSEIRSQNSDPESDF